MNEYDLYASGLSITEVSEETKIAKSTLRFRFKKAGILRGRNEAVRLAAKKGRMSHSGMKGKKHSPESKNKMSIAKMGKGKGTTLKPNGYIEYTAGPHKFRSVHAVLMEEKIGRRLFANECVHHKDENRSNNDIDNLQLMTRSEHARLHALENNQKRSRDKKGRYE